MNRHVWLGIGLPDPGMIHKLDLSHGCHISSNRSHECKSALKLHTCLGQHNSFRTKDGKSLDLESNLHPRHPIPILILLDVIRKHSQYSYRIVPRSESWLEEIQVISFFQRPLKLQPKHFLSNLSQEGKLETDQKLSRTVGSNEGFLRNRWGISFLSTGRMAPQTRLHSPLGPSHSYLLGGLD